MTPMTDEGERLVRSVRQWLAIKGLPTHNLPSVGPSAQHQPSAAASAPPAPKPKKKPAMPKKDVNSSWSW